jgi:hypothetical protein
MTPISLNNITYSQGLQLLAARKQALDSGHIQRMSKEAMATSFPLRDIGADYVEKIAESGLLDSLKSGFGGMKDKLTSGLSSMDPSTRNVLLSGLTGAGIGAGTGAVSSLLNGDEGAGWKALQGGLAGGAIGGGLGLAFNPEILSKSLNFGKKPNGSSVVSSNPTNSQQRAELIKSRTPAEQLDEINKLQGTAESSMPETFNYAAHGLNTAAAGGAGAYIANKSLYDPDALANRLRAEIQSSKGPTPPKTPGGKPGKPKGLDLTKLWYGMTNEKRNLVDPKNLHDTMRLMNTDQIKNRFNLNPLIPGTKPINLEGRLAAGVGDAAAKEMLEKVNLRGMFTGAGKLRAGKAGLLAALLGVLATGAGAIRGQYKQDVANRDNAKATLDALSNAYSQE